MYLLLKRYIMKIITVLFLSSLIFGVSCITQVKAEPQPVISKKYSDTEIEKQIQLHKSSHSKDVRPIEVVNGKFVSDFPQAKDIEWEIAADIYQVEFEIGFVDYEAYYDKNGELLGYSHDCKQSDMPALVINAIIAKYPDYNFEDIKKVISGTTQRYKVELEKNDVDVKVIVSSDGVILKEWLD